MKKKMIISGLLPFLILITGTIYYWGFHHETSGSKPSSTEKVQAPVPLTPPKGSTVSSGSTEPSSSQVQPTLNNITADYSSKWGNTPGNIYNGGFIASSGDYLYFNVPYFTDRKPQGLFRSMKDGVTGLTSLAVGEARSINIIGDWIYFIDFSNSLYRVRVNGRNTELLIPGPVMNPIVYDNNIYYIFNNNLMRKPLDNNNEATLLKSGVMSFTLSPDGRSVIFSDIDSLNGSTAVYKMSLDNATDIKTFQIPITRPMGMIFSYKDYIYIPNAPSKKYDEASEGLISIFRIDTSKETSKAQLYYEIPGNLANLNITGKYLYYSSFSSGHLKLIRKDLDKGSVEQLANSDIFNSRGLLSMNVLDDTLYFWSYDGDGALELCMYDTSRKVLKRNILP